MSVHLRNQGMKLLGSVVLTLAFGNADVPAYAQVDGVQPPTPDLGSGDSPTFGDVDMPNFGELDTPDFGQLDTPFFGDLRNPDFGDLNIPKFNGADSPDFSDLDSPDFTDLDRPRIVESDTPDVSPSDPNAVDARPISPFISPAESSGHLGSAIPLNLNLRATVLSDLGTNLGLLLNTQGNQLVVAGFDENSLIAPAGLLVGDQLLAIERHVIRSFDQFATALTSAIARDGRAWVLVLRDGQPVWVSLDLARRLRPTLGVNTTLENGTVIISNISSGSAADLAGLRVGDTILRVSGQEIHSHGELLDAIFSAAVGDGRLEIVVTRDRTPVTLIADVDQIEVAVRTDDGPDPMSGIVSESVSEELAEDGLPVAAETITSVFDSANAVLTATEGIAARTEGSLHDDAQSAAVVARGLRDKVREIEGDSPADLQGRITQLIAAAEELDLRLTTLAVQDLGDGEEALAEARQKISELQESLDAINASLTDAVP